MNHSPGPWQVCQEPFWKRSLVILDKTGKVVVGQATFAGHSDGFDEPEQRSEMEANAALIAAAPALYEALKKAHSWMELDAQNQMEEHDRDVYSCTMDAIEKALAQAKP